MFSNYFRLLPWLAIVPLSAHAEPTLYPKDITTLSPLRNSTDSNLVADYTDRRTVWVMPPNTATAQVATLHTKTANMGFCREMGDLQGYSRDLSQQMMELANKKKSEEVRLQKLKTRASLLNEEAEQFAVTKNLQVILGLDTQIESLDVRLQSLYEQLEKCTQGCELVAEDTKNTLRAKKDLLKQRKDLALQNAIDVREFDKKKAAAKAAHQSYADAREVFRELSSDIQKLRTDFLDAYKSFGSLEGARSALTYKSHWDENLSALRIANPGFNFSKMATKNAQLATELASLGVSNPSGAIMSVGLGGNLQASALKFPAYPETLSSNVVLSLIGACPMEHPEYFDLTNNDVSAMKYGIIISYDYDTVFEVNASARYNMYKMYQKIVSSGSSGGFFRSRSWSKVEEHNFFKDSFKVKWNDSENALAQEDKDKIEAQMRLNVLSRLAAIALPVSPDRAGIVAAAPPPPRGSVVIAESLVKTCPGNIYCMAGAAVFTVLDAIFGSSSSNSSYTNINDVEVVDDYASAKKVTHSWITSYVP